MQSKYNNGALLVHNGFTLHVTVHEREINYQITHPDGHQENITGMISVSTGMKPRICIPASLQERFGNNAFNATVVAWTYDRGIEA